MRVLLDTHALLWWTLDDPKLSGKARSIIASFESEVFVSAASATVIDCVNPRPVEWNIQMNMPTKR